MVFVPSDFRMGGPVAWKSVRLERTSQSSCEAEIRATNEGPKLTMAICNTAGDFERTGITISDASDETPVYNDNESCVNWSNNLTMKQTRHMELKENSIWECVQDKILKVLHVMGKCNPSDIFTKEMKDGAHFRRLRDLFMSPASAFLQKSLAILYRRQAAAVS